MNTSISLSSIIRGGWQLTPDHDKKEALADALAPVLDAVKCGFVTFDCADIYPGVEEIMGAAREAAAQRGVELRVHTKLVPDRDLLRSWSLEDTTRIVDRSLKRLKTDSLDLVQFHWWDFEVPRYLEALGHLSHLRDAGKVRAIGLTNFGHRRLQEVLSTDLPISSLQLQYSLLDRRCEAEVLSLCREAGVDVYAYGTLLGGFLSEEWLGRPEPDSVPNRSLVKYKLMIDDWGGWQRFQRLLRQLSEIAMRRNSSLSQIALGALLTRSRVNAAIVGLSRRRYQDQNRELCSIPRLDDAELEQLWSWDCPLEGDVYELERTNERHASIMKYNLQQVSRAQSSP